MTFRDLVERPEEYQWVADGRRWYEQTRKPSEGLSVPQDCADLAAPSTWPTVAVDCLAEEVRLSGIRGGDPNLHALVEEADLVPWVNRAVRDMLIDGVSFLSLDVAGRRARAFRADRVAARIDGMGNVIEASVKVSDDEAVYHEPDRITVYRRGDSGWHAVEEYDAAEGHFTALVNPLGGDFPAASSAIAPIMTLCDRAERVAAELQVAVELLALPVRMLAGDGASATVINGMPSVRDLAGEVLAGPAGAQLSELKGSTVEPMLSTLRYLALQVSALTGIPPHMLGVSSDANPTSADALRVAQDRLCQRAQLVRDGITRPVQSLLTALTGVGVEPVWATDGHVRDSQYLASVLQAHAQGAVSARAVQEALGFTPEQMANEGATL